MNKDGDVCQACNNTDVYRKWGKVGMYASYYTLICNICGHQEEKRESC